MHGQLLFNYLFVNVSICVVIGLFELVADVILSSVLAANN